MEQTKQRIVVKVGTSTLTHDSGALDLWSMEHLVRTLADLQGMGHQVILVTSGAIAVGTAKLGLPERPKELRMKQAAARSRTAGMSRSSHFFFFIGITTFRLLLYHGLSTRNKASRSGWPFYFIHSARICSAFRCSNAIIKENVLLSLFTVASSSAHSGI